MTGRAMGESEKSKHAPGVRILATRLPVVAIGGQDGFKAFRRHIGPGEGHASRYDLLRRLRKLVEEIICNDAEVASSGTATCTEEVGIACAVYPARDHLPAGIDCQNVDRGEPVHSQPVKSRQYSVTAAADMATGTHRKT